MNDFFVGNCSNQVKKQPISSTNGVPDFAVTYVKCIASGTKTLKPVNVVMKKQINKRFKTDNWNIDKSLYARFFI